MLINGSKIYIHCWQSNKNSPRDGQVHTYLFFSPGFCEKADNNHGNSTDPCEYDSKMKKINFGDNLKPSIFLATTAVWSTSGEVEPHPDHTNNQTDHQAPECTLKGLNDVCIIFYQNTSSLVDTRTVTPTDTPTYSETVSRRNSTEGTQSSPNSLEGARMPDISNINRSNSVQEIPPQETPRPIPVIVSRGSNVPQN